ncbi:hypothetical protein Moror_11308 [Moniliophthora roreri MCA 2997]|uniref:Uncharacterized protein n=1 Tax=Moniliophthora roreri (strain MCA 2997) TaxID=1381753 RepID=V2WJ16_MONRO|nr:hypothetical protein Moror_11308 [Moniliophthora roreri MCA 2997]
MSFKNSSGFSFKGNDTFNHVEGNQFNGQVINVNSHAAAKRTKYDEFDYVKSGHIITLKTLHTENDWHRDCKSQEWRIKSRKTIHTIELHNNQQSKYTAVMYEGKDARTLWEEDFRWFSRTRNPSSFQLFGINRSEIPALIFHHELVPCAHFYTRSFWMNVYIQHLRKNMGCWDYMLWMNTTTGVLLRGPDGPSTRFRSFGTNESIVVPPTVDMLKDDASFRFFSKLGLSVDISVLNCAVLDSRLTSLHDLFPRMVEDHQSDHPDWSLVMLWYLRSLWRNPPDHLPMDVIGGLRFDTVYSPSMEAVARRPREAGSLWKWWKMDGLVDRTELDGGLIRFKLDPVQGERIHLRAKYERLRFCQEWLSQSPRVFDALDVTEGKENFFIVEPPDLTLRYTQRPRTFSTLRNAEHPTEETPLTPVYLSLHPLPATLSELVSWTERPRYFWSFDKTGQSRLSEEECERWGLPVLVFDTDHPTQFELYSLPTHIYAALQDWQKARGFDPTTSDWARSMGYLELEIIGTEDRFVLIEEPLAEDLDWEVLDS